MGKLSLKNIDSLSAPFIRLRPGMTSQEFIDLWECYHIQRLVALEWCENLYEEYVFGRTPNE